MAEGKGFTLIEILFVVIIVGILMFPIARHFAGVRRAWEGGDERAELMQNARIGMDKIERELRQLTSIISVTEASDTNGKIVFVDINNNTATFQRFQSGGYHWLGYDTSGSPQILAGPVDSLKFICYEEDGTTQTTKPRAIKSVEFEMIVGSQEAGVPSQTFTSRAFIGKDLLTLSINEIMYNPSPSQGNDEYNEWVELYNYGVNNIDVDGWSFDGDTLEGDDVYGDGSTVIPAGGYAVITDRDTRIYSELIQNGGFESSDLSMWPRSSSWILTWGGHSGAWKIARYNAGWIYQQVSIPSQARSAFFSCWEFSIDNPAITRLIITVRNTGGGVIETLYDGQMSNVWTQHTADISDYAGTTIRIYFETGSSGTYGLDDISIIWSYVDKDAVKLRVADNSIGDDFYWGMWVFTGLSDDSEPIDLVVTGANGQTVDSLTYDDAWGGDDNGYTLERIDPEDTSDSSDNWEESAQVMGTPGFKNDATP